MTNQSQAVAASGELPPLPEPTGDIRLPGAFGLACDGYTANQMRAYLSEGTASLVAENERLRARNELLELAREQQHEYALTERAKYDALRTQLAEAQKDAQRLDWLDAQWCDGVHLEVCATGGTTMVQRVATVWPAGESCPNVRAAIDAALTPKEQP